MFSYHFSKQPKIRKICYLFQKPRAHSQNRITQNSTSLAHLSSAFQQQTKKALKKQTFEQNMKSFLSQQSLKNSSIKQRKKFPIKQIKRSKSSGRKKVSQDQMFLSEIFDQQCLNIGPEKSQTILAEREVSKSKRKNYVLRKLQFENFINTQSIKNSKPAISTEEIQQVVFINERKKFNSSQCSRVYAKIKKIVLPCKLEDNSILLA